MSPVAVLCNVKNLYKYSVLVQNGETFSCTANNLVVDTNCDLPVSGSYVVQNSDSETAEFDFSNTSCENRTVTYTYNGVEYTYDLNDIDT